MASVDISYNCGCGYSTKKLEAATEHADSTGHSLTIVGSIKAPKIAKELKAAAKNPSKAKPKPVVEEASIDTGFESLRNRLRGAGNA